MIIRELEQRDVAACIEMGGRMHEESEYSALMYSPDKCHELAELIMNSDSHIWLVAEEDGELMGMLGGECSAPYFTDDLAAGDHLIYVKPGKRGGFTFFVLVQRFIKWAVESGAKLIYLRNSTGIKSGQVEKLYQRLGFSRVGGIYRRKV